MLTGPSCRCSSTDGFGHPSGSADAVVQHLSNCGLTISRVGFIYLWAAIIAITPLLAFPGVPTSWVIAGRIAFTIYLHRPVCSVGLVTWTTRSGPIFMTLGCHNNSARLHGFKQHGAPKVPTCSLIRDVKRLSDELRRTYRSAW